MARRTKRLWTDEEKRSICLQTTARDVSVAQVARRYSMNANLIFTWLRDPRYAPQRRAEPDAACFLPVEIVDRPLHDDDCRDADDLTHSAGRIEIDIAGGHRLRKGQVENQVGVMRRRFFVPRPRFKTYAELNAWLEDRCIAWAKANPHPEWRDKTIREIFEAERGSLVPYVGPFDGFHAVPAAVSKTCLVRFDKNRYSVEARAVGRPVEIRA